MKKEELLSDIINAFAGLNRAKAMLNFQFYLKGENFLLSHLQSIGGESTPGELASVLDVSAPRVAAILRSLEIKKLVEEGMLRFDTDIRGEQMEKKIYYITDQGHNEFLSWLKDDVPIERTFKDIFRLRTYYSESLSEDEFLKLLQSQLNQHTEKRDFLAGIMKKEFNNKAPQKGTAELGDYMVLDGAILRENAYIDWLQNCIKLYK